MRHVATAERSPKGREREGKRRGSVGGRIGMVFAKKRMWPASGEYMGICVGDGEDVCTIE